MRLIRKLFIHVALSAMLFALCFSVEAQPKKIPRMGFLGGSSASAYSSFLEAFRQSLRDLGYEEGRKFAIDYRYGEGKRDRLPGLSADLVRLKVDVIVVSGTLAISALRNATKTIPIVMTTVEDPVAQGFVASLARPGGNITGLTNLAPELSGKRLELLKESFPKISRVAVLRDPVLRDPLSPSKRLRPWPRHWVFNLNPWRYGTPTISSVHSGQQPRNEPALSSCCKVSSPMLTGNG